MGSNICEILRVHVSAGSLLEVNYFSILRSDLIGGWQIFQNHAVEILLDLSSQGRLFPRID